MKKSEFSIEVEEVYVDKFDKENSSLMKLYYIIRVNNKLLGSFRLEEVEEVLKMLITGRKYLQSPTRLWQ